MNMVDVVCVGLNVVNFPIFPVDESIFTRDISPVSPITLLPGGDAANQAIILSRLGLKTALLSRRGNGMNILQKYLNGRLTTTW